MLKGLISTSVWKNFSTSNWFTIRQFCTFKVICRGAVKRSENKLKIRDCQRHLEDHLKNFSIQIFYTSTASTASDKYHVWTQWSARQLWFDDATLVHHIFKLKHEYVYAVNWICFFHQLDQRGDKQDLCRHQGIQACQDGGWWRHDDTHDHWSWQRFTSFQLCDDLFLGF